MTGAHELAQLNIARLRAPIDSPGLRDFVDNLDRINALAETSPGFVWRLETDVRDPHAPNPFGEDVIVNMSVWTDLVVLKDYVYRSAHAQVLRRRKEWFEKIREAYAVLWWVPAGHRPTVSEARARLEHLREQGPGPHAFTFKRPFAAPAQWESQPLPAVDDTCPAG